MNVAVAGLGKIGVPLCVQFASRGATVVGYDINRERVAEINAGRNPIGGEPGLDDALPRLARDGRLRATDDPRDAFVSADVVVVIVPVDIDVTLQPEFSALDAAVDAMAPHLRHGTLVIVETTVPVGTTRGRVGSRIAAATGLTPGADLALAFSPERVSSGRVLRDLATYPKIVGGVDAASSARAAAFYREMLDADVIIVRDAETAEFSKLAETTYRDVNIALANEFARLGDRIGVDVREAIAAANSQPYSHVHDPGPGVGGHCIPVYPYFLAGPETELINTARRTNDAMAQYGAQRLEEVMGSLGGATAIVLGLAYRPNVKESRHSSAYGLVRALTGMGATAYVHDALYTDAEIRAHGFDPPPSFPMPCDALIVQAWHAAYETLDFGAFAGLRAVLDARASVDPARVRGAGAAYAAIGRPAS